MILIDTIDLNNLDKYSNVDVSTIKFDHESCKCIARLDYATLIKFIDIFDDVNKFESGGDDPTYMIYTLGDNIIYFMYSNNFVCDLPTNERIGLLFKLSQKGFSKSKFDDKDYIGTDFEPYINHKMYLTKYSTIISNLFRLTNSNTIDISNIDDHLIDTIKVLLSVTKLRILPKYIILHKILLFYLC